MVRKIPDFVMSDVTYQVVPMSTDFSHCYLNGDKLITPEEFSSAEKLPLEEVYDIFKFADGDVDMDARINSMIQEKNGRKSEAEANPTKISTTFTSVVRDMNNNNISLNETTPSNITADAAAIA